jgi:hypothetical protein
MVNMCRAHHTEPVLLTLATLASREMTPEALEKMHLPYYTTSVARFLGIVEAYNRCLYDVARETGTILVDSAAYFDSLPDKEQYFFDSMHMYKEGYGLLARYVAQVLKESDIFEAAAGPGCPVVLSTPASPLAAGRFFLSFHLLFWYN